MAKFKKGDRVRSLKDENTHDGFMAAGSLATVDENNSICPYVIFDGQTCAWAIHEEDIEPAKPASNFKVGDRVRILDTVPSGWWFEPGMEATIDFIDEGELPYQIGFDGISVGFDGISVGFVGDVHIELVETKPQPHFNVGDLVTGEHWMYGGDLTGKVIEVDVGCEIAEYRIADGWLKTGTVKAAQPKPAHIVCLLDDKGSPKPSASPHPHYSEAEATKEAECLALKHPGKRFAVYSPGAVREAETVTTTKAVLKAA
ncbi:hypothetical protein E2A64_10120 [Pseudohoeflea suaedae]|uniref:Uncharacterized protein n=1 Tax=Pseudohoeflea suaedae TaxID=877384 RepID=A0A4R5PJ59_9HYPH|nr:hypothetical protein [Pseudohoeflea suaedae]TDH35687.1 hypothetical protein E2A64_10120 [Pseudohoeflea suaedae]